MALVITDLQCANIGGNRVFIYNTADDVGAANYFDAAAHILNVGDHIIQSNGTNAKHYTVLTNDGAAVTVGQLSTT